MSWGVGSGDGAPRGFLRLLAARLTSQVADGWFQAALAGNLLFSPERRAGSIAIAAGFAILLLPYSVLGPFVGVFLDHLHHRPHDRQRVLQGDRAGEFWRSGCKHLHGASVSR